MKKEKYMIGFLVAAGFALFTFQLTRESLWLDEIYTYYASDTWNSLTATIGWKEKNMWLFHSIMYFWKFVFPGEFGMRFLSVVFGVAGVVAMYKLAREIGGKYTGLTASILLLVNTFYVQYAQEARAYSLFTFLFLLSSYYLILLLKNNSLTDRKKYIFSTVLSIYSHVFTWVFIPLQMAFLLLKAWRSRGKLSTFIITGFVLVLSMLPIVVTYILKDPATAATRSRTALSWIEKPDFESIINLYYLFSSSSASTMALYFFLIIVLIFSIILKRNKLDISAVSYIFAMTVIPPFAIFVFSWIYAPFFIPRYLAFTLPAFLLLVALGISTIKNRYIATFLVAILLLLNLKSLAGFFTTYRKEQWRQTVEYIYENKKEGEKVVIFPTYLRLPFEYYAQGNAKYNASNVVIAFPGDIRDYSPETVELNIATLGAQLKTSPGVWVVSRKDNKPEPRAVQKNALNKMFQESFGRKQDIDEFTAIEVDYYTILK